jgi:hypothetical protein
LELTQGGKQIIANLYANVFQVEHAEPLAFTKLNDPELITSGANSKLNGDKDGQNPPAPIPGERKKFTDFRDLNL